MSHIPPCPHFRTIVITAPDVCLMHLNWINKTILDFCRSASSNCPGSSPVMMKGQLLTELTCRFMAHRTPTTPLSECCCSLNLMVRYSFLISSDQKCSLLREHHLQYDRWIGDISHLSLHIQQRNKKKGLRKLLYRFLPYVKRLKMGHMQTRCNHLAPKTYGTAYL